MNQPKRLRIFAGPNGSGKSSLVPIISDKQVDLGIYVNADNIKKELQETRCLDFATFSLSLDLHHLKGQFRSSSLYPISNGNELSKHLHSLNNQLSVSDHYPINDYFTAFLSEYLRNQLLNSCNKFTIETVMSHVSKIEFLKTAKEQGFKIYLYFISLENSE